MCSKLESRGYCMLSVSLSGAILMARGGAWRDGDVSVVSEHDVVAVLCEYARDVNIDVLLAEVLHRRCGLGRAEASNWIVQCTAAW